MCFIKTEEFCGQVPESPPDERENKAIAGKELRSLLKFMKDPLSIIVGALVFCMLACNPVKTVEHTDGIVTDRYTIDKKGQRHGEFRRFFGGDTLAEVSNYVHGLLHGIRTIYNAAGAPEIQENYVNDVLHGTYRVFYENGDIKIEGEYIDGAMRGVWKRYYPGGRLLEEVTYEDNVENGPFVEYHENGNPKARGQYLEGDFEHDTLYLFDEGGVLMRKMLCNRGICRTFWLAEGVVDE
jgi:antitoxin component YwqK of YwqJK toxin-antitoxin module